MSDNEKNSDEVIAAALARFLTTRAAGNIIEEKLGMDPDTCDVAQVLKADATPPEGWVQISCMTCDQTGWVPPGTITPEMAPMCPDCAIALAANLS